MNSAISWIICAAGEGVRFQKAGISIPKPLIRLKGLSLLERSLKSLPIRAGDHLTIITLRKHQVRQSLEGKIKKKYAGARIRWLELGRPTSGQLSSFLKARSLLSKTQPVALYNCDTFFRIAGLRKRILAPQSAGVIPCARESGSSWSFCRVNLKREVIDIAEKKRISPWASVGLYSFSNARELLRNAQRWIRHQKGEHYVAPFYKDYLDRGQRIEMLPVTIFRPCGTPEQIKKYWKVEVHELR
jgi:dTDP-glucose pyrophosphorylase